MERNSFSTPYSINCDETRGYTDTFEIGRDGYYIPWGTGFEYIRNEYLSKISPILTEDDAEGGEDGVYTWIIGSGPEREYPDDEIHLFSAKSNYTEIQTKHNHIMHAICINSGTRKKMTSGEIRNNIEVSTPIDKYYYAGEYNKITKPMTGENGVTRKGIIKINFLSGTYMLGKVDPKNPSEEAIYDVNDIFNDAFPDYGIVFSNTGKTYIDYDIVASAVDEGMLYDYFMAGAPIYKFNLNDPGQKALYDQAKEIHYFNTLPLGVRQEIKQYLMNASDFHTKEAGDEMVDKMPLKLTSREKRLMRREMTKSRTKRRGGGKKRKNKSLKKKSR